MYGTEVNPADGLYKHLADLISAGNLVNGFMTVCMTTCETALTHNSSNTEWSILKSNCCHASLQKTIIPYNHRFCFTNRFQSDVKHILISV